MMTAEQLKVSIYLLLFSGKLTEQLADDGTAKELLKRIEKKNPSNKKVLRIIKKENGDYFEVAGTKETCISDELLFDIPDNWAWVHLNEIAVSGLGKTLNKSKDTGDTKKYLCSINVYWDGIHLDEIKEAKFSESDIEKYKLMKGDLLICEGGDAGRTAIWEYENEMYYQNALHRVRFWEGIDPYYFRALMEFYKLNGTIDSYCKGMTIKHLVQGSLNAMRFPLPPLAEQKRIVAKIEELMPFVDQYAVASTRLNTLNATFPEMMKKSILQEAVQGKLVPQDPNDEPASVLLKKIAEEKKRLIKEGKIKKQKPLPEITEDEIPFDIPESWEWVRLGSYFITSSGTTPSKSNAAYYDRKDFNWVRTTDLNNGILDKCEIQVSQKAYEECRLEVIPQDSVCIAMYGGGGTIGKNALIRFDTTINQSVCAIHPNGCNMKYVQLFMQYIRPRWMDYASGSRRDPNINQIIIKNSLIPIPPLKEQERIVKITSKLIGRVEQMKMEKGKWKFI